MSNKKSLIASWKSSILIRTKQFKECMKMSKEDFTRNRKMLFEDLILVTISLIHESTQTALRRYFRKINRKGYISQQAFQKARHKIRYEAYKELFEMTVETFYADGDYDQWNNYRVIAIDGSDITLPNTPELKEKYGTLGPTNSSTTGLASMMYDVLNDIIIDATLEPLTVDERTQAMRHMEKLKAMGNPEQQLLLFDRGYPSEKLLRDMEHQGFKYLFRVSKSFNTVIDAQKETDKVQTISITGKKHIVRILKIMLPSGETETLMTNLFNTDYTEIQFKELYGLRWSIETGFDILKTKLQLENFSGKTELVIMQDFYSVCYLANMAALFAWDADKDNKRKKADLNKYQYTINMNYVIGVLKDELVCVLALDRQRKQAKLLKEILHTISRCVIPIRPNRSFPRNHPRYSRFHPNIKLNS